MFLNFPFTLPVGDACAAFGAADGTIDKMLYT